jgi:hypothetical protein
MPAPAAIALLPSVVEMGGKLIDRIFPDKTKQAAERAAAEMAVLQMHRDGDLKEMATAMSAIIAEAQSADPWTSRARPSFLYVMYVMILMSIPMGVLSAFAPEIAARIAGGMKSWLAAMPEELYWLFGTGYLGYAGFRSYDKRATQPRGRG